MNKERELVEIISYVDDITLVGGAILNLISCCAKSERLIWDSCIFQISKKTEMQDQPWQIVMSGVRKADEKK